MKYLTIILAGISMSGALADVNAQTPCNLDWSTVAEYNRYEDKATGKWALLIVPPKTSVACLKAFAEKLHGDNPDVQFEFFDAQGPELLQYFSWASNGMKEGDPYPEKWLSKHNVATLQPMSDGVPCARWQLFDRDHNSLAKFDRIKCGL